MRAVRIRISASQTAFIEPSAAVRVSCSDGRDASPDRPEAGSPPRARQPPRYQRTLAATTLLVPDLEIDHVKRGLEHAAHQPAPHVRVIRSGGRKTTEFTQICVVACKPV